VTENLHREIDAVDWNAFRSGAGEGGGDLLARGLHLLVSAEDEAAAVNGFDLIEDNAIVQGSLYEIALPTARMLLRVLDSAEPLPCHRAAALMLGYLGAGEPHWTENSTTRPTLTWLDRLRPRNRQPPDTGVRLKQDIHDLLTDNTRVLRAMLGHPDPVVRQFGIVMVGDYDHSPAAEQALKHMIETDADQTVRDVAALPADKRNWEAWANAQNETFRGWQR
jgi:hypothetical protein